MTTNVRSAKAFGVEPCGHGAEPRP